MTIQVGRIGYSKQKCFHCSHEHMRIAFEIFLIISGKYSSSSAALVFANGQCEVLASPNQSLTLRMAVLYYAESGSRLKQFFITKYHLG